MADKLKWDSNNGQVADREFAIARVRDGKLDLCTDEKTGRFVGVHLERETTTLPDPFRAIAPTDLEFKMAEGAIDAVVNRFIPAPYPFPDADGNSVRMYDLVVGGVTYTFDPVLQDDIIFVVGAYTIHIGFWGFVWISYDSSNESGNPGDAQTTTILTITQFRAANVAGTAISAPFTNSGAGFDINLTGKTPSADVTAPTIQSVLPSGTGIALDSTITVNASEEIVVGTGNYTIRNVDTSSTHETVAAAGATYSGPQAVITPSVAQDYNTNYALRLDGGVFEDLAGNPVAAVSTDIYTWRTVAAPGGGGGGPVAADVIVSSLSALYLQLASWEGNWNGTTPSGKTNSDVRVVALNASTTGLMDLSGYSFPQRVYVRHTGTFASNITCTVNHIGTGSLNNSQNLWVYLMDLRAPNSGSFDNGLWFVDNTTNCGIVRCALNGWPFSVVGSNTGTTSYAFVANGSTDLTIMNNTYTYFGDGICKFFGTHTRLHFEGNIGRWIGGDDITVGADGHLIDPLVRCNYYCRDRAKGGAHNDGWQFNGNGAGSRATRWVQEYDVFLRGVWTGQIGTPGETGWGADWMSGGIASTPPHLVQHCLFVNGHNRAITVLPGGGTTAQFNSCIQHDNHQPPNAAWPYIRGTSVSTRNFVTGPNSSYNTQPGTGGLLYVLGGDNSTAVGANYSLLLTYLENYPTSFTDLWDIRPKAGTILHPDYTPSGNRIGCFGLWQKLFNGDADIVLSKVGWPVAPAFITYYDRSDNFWGSYTGNFDANGDNI